MQVADLPVHHKLIQKLNEKNIVELTEIQQKTILPALQGKDILGSSKTGSGKTLAFLIPAVQRLLTQKALSKQDPRALILAPTRELAKQVYAELKGLISKLPLQSVLVLGGENYNDQVKQLRRNPDFIVGTAGRIADHLKDRSFFIQGLELLIFDEADRMLDLGFAEQLNLINDSANHRKRQTMLFSATLDNLALNHLSSKLLKAPVRVAVGSATERHEEIEQTLYFADNPEHKDALLLQLLNRDTYNQAIVFTATREDTIRLHDLLKNNDLSVVALSGDLLQNQRANVMSAFSRGQFSILVTTDVASRGLDLLKVGLVINYDLPKMADEYIHRIGRTGRAGNKGFATSLVGPRDWDSYVAINAQTDYPLECEQHVELPAKFKGRRVKSARTNETTNAAKGKGNQQQRVRKPAKRVDSLQGKEVGDAPLRRRPRAASNAPIDNDEEE